MNCEFFSYDISTLRETLNVEDKQTQSSEEERNKAIQEYPFLNVNNVVVLMIQ